MAYYSSNYHDPYLGETEGYLTPYGGNCDIVPSHNLMADSSYEFSIRDFFAYEPTPYYDAYDPGINHSVISYSVSSFTEPKSIVYDPYSGDYGHAPTHYRISYSVSGSEFNEPEFEEYDPTPYGGGYDLDSTYGKPLPPSDELCYPRSTPADSTALPLDGVTLGSIESPYGKEDVGESAPKPHIENKQAPIPEDKQQLDASIGDDQNSENHGSSEKPSDLCQGEDGHEDYCDGNPPWSNHESSGYEKMVPQIPPGYGLEAMDLCESIFGYWPCLARDIRRSHDCQQFANRESSSNKWKETADYLFGSSNPYEESRAGGGSYGHLMYSYERHHGQQPLYTQVEYDEDSRMHKFNIF